MINIILKNPLNIVIIFYLIFSSLVIYAFNLNISPDGKEFLECSKDLFNRNCKYQYFTTFIIFKILNILNFELSFQIFNLTIFFFIFFYSIKLLNHFNVKIDSNLKLFYFLFLFLFNYDFSQWINYALSDLILILNILISLYLYLRGKYKLLLIIILFSFLIKRQSIIMLMILLFVFFDRKNLNNSFLRSLFNLSKIYIPIFFILFTFYVTKEFNYELPTLFNNISGVINFVFFKTIEDGVIVMNRIYIENQSNDILSILKMYLYRFVYCLSFYFDDYSLKHKIYNIVYFLVLVTPLFFVFFVKNLSLENKKILNMNFSITILILIFISITFLDYDMRYRIYIFPFIIMNNYILISNILNKLKKND